MQVEIKQIPAYKLLITGALEIMDSLYNYLSSTEIVGRPIKKYGKIIFQKEMRIVNLSQKYNHKTSEMIIDKGFYYFLLMYLYELKQKYPQIGYKTNNINIKGELKLTDKWRAILRPDQIEAFEKLAKLKGSLCQIATGEGKTEIFLALVESYLEQFPDKNVIITAPKDPIIAEIKSRIILRNMSQYLENKRIWILNPLGFMRSSLKENLVMLNYFQKFGMRITDEIHRSDCASYKSFYNLCPNIEYSYGFTGTASKLKLNKADNFKLFEYKAQKLIGYTGPSIVCKFAKDKNKQINYYRVEGNLGKGNTQAEDYCTMAQSVIKGKQFLNCILNIIRHHPDKNFYIPCTWIESGNIIADYLNAHKIPALHWAGGFICNYPEIDNLSKIKEAINTKAFRVLIATSASNEGVDIKGLDNAILILNKEEKGTIQTLGRVGRGEGNIGTIFNIMNKDQGILKNQALQREKHIKLHYDCEVKKIKL
jgi:hypothetical protein